MTPNELRAARKERARRWASAPDMRGYPALADEEETEETLASSPAERAEKRLKPGD
jgi:hypothetical protein